MDNAGVFKYLVTNKAFPDLEIKDHEFKFRTVFRQSGSTYCCCRCAVDHEYFTYISDTGGIDLEKFEILVKAVKDGYCQHTTNENVTQYITETKFNLFSETRVSVYHLAAALGEANVSRQILSLPTQRRLKRWEKKTTLFQLLPYEIAVFKGREKLQRYVALWKSFDQLTVRGRFLDDTIIHVTEKENDKIQVDSIPVYQLYIMKKCIPPVKMIFDASELSDLGGRSRIYEHLFMNNLTSDLEEIVSLSTDVNNCTRAVRNVLTVAKLSVVYNAQYIFQMSIQKLSNDSFKRCLSQSDRKELLEMCGVLQRHDFQRILQDNLYIELRTPLRVDVISTFALLYHLLVDYPLSVDHIKKAMEQIPDHENIVNVPFAEDCGKNEIHHNQGLTPLQAYVLNYNRVKVPVIKALIDLGADIDVVFPPNLKIYYKLSKFFAGKNRETTPAGQSLLLYILNEERGFETNFRQILEIFLYENVSLDLNRSAVATCLESFKYNAIPCISSRDSCRCTAVDRKKTPIASGTYFMDAAIHEIPAYFTIQLLIDAGFEYSCANIDEVLHADDIKQRNELRQHLKQTGKRYHIDKTYPHKVEVECLKNCVSHTRSLKLRCRDVLRSHFPKRQIHKYVNAVAMPAAIRDFLLLKPILRTLESYI